MQQNMGQEYQPIIKTLLPHTHKPKKKREMNKIIQHLLGEQAEYEKKEMQEERSLPVDRVVIAVFYL